VIPLLPHPASATPLASALGLTPDEAVAFLAQTSVRAWALPSGLLLLTDILPAHRAEVRYLPSAAPDPAELRSALAHLFDLFQFRVLYAILPIEGADAAASLLLQLGFHQQGVLPLHRRSSRQEFSDDLLYSLSSWERSVGPRLASGLAARSVSPC
jgi:hypothetical protein